MVVLVVLVLEVLMLLEENGRELEDAVYDGVLLDYCKCCSCCRWCSRTKSVRACGAEKEKS